MRGTIFAALIVGAAVAAGCNAKDGRDPGPMTAKDFSVGDFKRIESAGAYDVTVRTGSGPSVRAEGPQKVLDRLVIEVKGDELLIHPRNGSNFHWGKSPPIKIAVTVPELQGATIAGSGTISVDKVVTDRFKGTIAGSGDLSLPSITAKSVEFEIAGSGSASLAGQTDRADYVIAGSGELSAAGLKAKDVKLSIAGSGSLDANASGTVRGEIVGSGEARVSGGAQCNVEKVGSGELICS
jgi:Putative auto-transporter adhesin, head GIN domain